MTNPFANAINEAAAQTNMNEASKGGEFTPPAEGLVRLRLVGYIELGKHDKEFKGQKKQVDLVQVVFEASGPKHPPREDGSPILFSERLTKSTSEKAKFFKLFRRMNPTGSATHMAQLLGKAFIATVHHNTSGEGDNKRTYANLTDAEGVWTIKEPFIDNVNPESGDVTRMAIQVDEPKTPIRCFLWDYANKEQWDSLFIDGMWEAKTDDNGKELYPAKSKNVYQNTIKAAHNWQGSPMQEILFAGGEADVPNAETPDRSPDAAGSASDDPLEGAG